MVSSVHKRWVAGEDAVFSTQLDWEETPSLYARVVESRQSEQEHKSPVIIGIQLVWDDTRKIQAALQATLCRLLQCSVSCNHRYPTVGIHEDEHTHRATHNGHIPVSII